jgi:hypothetical protein
MSLSSFLDVEWLLSTLFDASLLKTSGRPMGGFFFDLIHSVNPNAKLTERLQTPGVRLA